MTPAQRAALAAVRPSWPRPHVVGLQCRRRQLPEIDLNRRLTAGRGHGGRQLPGPVRGGSGLL